MGLSENWDILAHLASGFQSFLPVLCIEQNASHCLYHCSLVYIVCTCCNLDDNGNTFSPMIELQSFILTGRIIWKDHITACSTGRCDRRQNHVKPFRYQHPWLWYTYFYSTQCSRYHRWVLTWLTAQSKIGLTHLISIGPLLPLLEA